MLMWLLVLLGLVAAGHYAYARSRNIRDDRQMDQSSHIDMCLYLDEPQIIKFYQSNTDNPVLKKEVEKFSSRHRSGGIGAGVFKMSIEGAGDTTEERRETWADDVDSVRVIREVLRTLEKRQGIVYLDLHTGMLRHNEAIGRLLRKGAVTSRSLQLSEIKEYLWISCKISLETDTENRTTFQVHYPVGFPHPSLKIAISCAINEMPNTDPGDTINAYVLGKVGWNTTAGSLVVHPMAIFR